MKTTSPFYFLLFALFISCEDSDEVRKAPRYRASRIEEIGYTRALTYNALGQVILITSESEMVDKEVISTVQHMEYDANGNVVRSTINDGRVYSYTWENGRIVTTEEKQAG